MNIKQNALVILIPVIFLLVLAGGVLADGVEDPTDNWCYAGGPWGDGRCSDSNPDIANWYWTCGYYRAQVVKGTMGDTQIPETCQVPRRLLFQEASSGGGGGGGGTTTFSAAIEWCQYDPVANTTQFMLSWGDIPDTTDILQISSALAWETDWMVFPDNFSLTETVSGVYTEITGTLNALGAGRVLLGQGSISRTCTIVNP